MNIHKTMIHGQCPVNGQCDYYDLTIETQEFIQAEKIEEIASVVRGMTETQESIASLIHMALAQHANTWKLTLVGRHGQNVQTTVEKVADETK